MQEYGIKWIDENNSIISAANDSIWNYAETGLMEYQSAEYLKRVLKEHGFSVEAPVASMDTAFAAVWGSGEPTIGFLGEYDALPGLSQKVSAEKEPLSPGKPGHGCGHNTYAAAILGGALGLRYELEYQKQKGTVVFFGCPAEELLIGKVKMAKAGVFHRCDVLLSCHPNDIGYVWARTSNAFHSLKFNFHGVTAHAAIDPFNGRSALDAVELMNIGANYLREHMKPEDRIHYVITSGGTVPNIVPDHAQVWYNIRSGSNESVKELTKRVKKVAEGAAMMTETSVQVEEVSACSGILRNPPLEKLLLECMNQTGTPQWSQDEYNFAEQISKQIPEDNLRQTMQDYGLEKEAVRSGLSIRNFDGYYQEGSVMTVSTDVGDASWNAPTGVFSFASTVVGSPGHSWFYTACCGSSIAHKGAVMAAKVLERAAMRLIMDQNLLNEVELAFQKEKGEREYMCPLDNV